MFATDQRVPSHSRHGPSLAVIVVPPSCRQQGRGRGCTTPLRFQLNPRGKYLEHWREICTSFQKWNADKIQRRAEGRRKANPTPRFPAEAAKRAALKLANARKEAQTKRRSSTLCFHPRPYEALRGYSQYDRCAFKFYPKHAAGSTPATTSSPSQPPSPSSSCRQSC